MDTKQTDQSDTGVSRHNADRRKYLVSPPLWIETDTVKVRRLRKKIWLKIWGE